MSAAPAEGDPGAGPVEPSAGLLDLALAAAERGEGAVPAGEAAEEGSWVRSVVALFGPAGPFGGPWTRAGLFHALDAAIADIDVRLSVQLDAILHHRRFQRLEASWRSLRRLVRLADECDNTKVRVLHIGWPELCRDLDRAIEFDQSQAFGKIYSEEFGTPGGEPFGLIIGDYEVQHRRTADHPTDDIAALKAMSEVAAAAFAPFIVAAAPAFFGVDSFRDLTLPIDFANVFRSAEYARWRTLQEGEDARFVGIVLPRVLARRPYGDDGTRFDGFRYREAIEDEVGERHLWGSAAYAFAAVVIRGFGGSGWFTDLRGARRERLVVGDSLQPHGGLVAHLPAVHFATDQAGLVVKPSSEIALTERQEKDLADLGFLPLLAAKDTEFCIFYSNQSIQLPRTYDSAAATANARISAMLQYILCVSRFAHYLKVMARDRVGSFSTPEQCEDALQHWLRDYCTSNANPSPELMARCPLRQGRVEVSEPPGRPGSYRCIVHLRPHSQVDQVVSEFRLVTELAPRAA